jgi:succinylarginine dihydrolase
MNVFELNIDGLIGPTHNYAGLSLGNVASKTNAYSTASPKLAVKQGIKKMRLLHNMGVKQALFPPHARPNIPLLNQLGFSGKNILKDALKTEPKLLIACFSASNMWAANAATITASLDSLDNKLHFTAANLISNFHRHQETPFTQTLLKRYFANKDYFIHHPPLPNTSQFGDEGAANHTRICENHATPGMNFYVYGKHGFNPELDVKTNFPARQSFEASMAISRTHRVNTPIYAMQHPDAIESGVFHNDVIATGNESVYLFHEYAYKNKTTIINQLKELADFDLKLIEINAKEVPLKDAVTSYLFNSQLVTIDNNHMVLIAPSECENTLSVKTKINKLIADNSNPIKEVNYLDLRQSMKNGGGPACLRLRVPLNEKEFSQMKQSIIVDNNTLDALDTWADKHYRDRLHIDDLTDSQLITESHVALDELTQLLDLGNIYYFQ